MSELKVDKITPRLGTTLTLGDAGDTINFGSGVLPNFENLTVTGDLTVDTNSLKVDSTNNRVGIGTSSPSTTLHLAQSLPQIRLEDTDTGAYGTISGQSTAGSLFIRADDGNTVANSVLGFSVDNDQKMTIDSSGNVGIGTTSPSSYNSLADNLVVGANAGDNGITIASGTANGGRIIFSDNTVSPFRGAFEYDHSTDGMIFYTNGTEAMRILNNGALAIGNTNAGSALLSVQPNNAYLRMQAGSIDATNNVRLEAGGNTSNYLEYRGYLGHIWVNNTTERMRIDSSGNVGIGTSSPSYTLQVDHQGAENVTIVAKGTAPGFGLYDTTASAYNWALYNSNGELAFYNTLNTNGFNSLSEKMRITTAGNVGIGTSTPSRKLTVTGGEVEIRDGNYFMMRPSGNAWDMRLQAVSTRLDIVSGGATGSPIATFVHGGNVGIGTSSPNQILEVLKSGGGQIRISETSDRYVQITGYAEGTANGSTMAFSTVQTGTSTLYERMRINHSGRVGIGETNPTGSLHIRARDSDGADVFVVTQSELSNRQSGYKCLDENNNVGLVMKYDNGPNNAIIQNAVNGNIDLYLGGTTSANALDDYETGTWTPTYTSSSGSFSSITYDNEVRGFYTKIGKLVVAQAFIMTDAISVGTASGDALIGGLPFTVKTEDNQVDTGGGGIGNSTNFGGDNPIGVFAQRNFTRAYLSYKTTSNGNSSFLNVSDLGTGTNQNQMRISIIYRAD